MIIKLSKIIYIKIIFTLLFGFSNLTTINAQTSDLYYQIKKSNFNIENTRKSLDNLSRSIHGRSSTKKQKAKLLQTNARIISQKSNIAYNRARQIIKKLEEGKNYELAEKVGELKSNLHSLNYAANALDKYCQWMINKPKVHGAKSFKNMVKAFNTIIENYNKASKNKKILFDVISWESYQSIKDKV